MQQLHTPSLLVSMAFLSTTICLFFAVNWLSRREHVIYVWMSAASLCGALGCITMLLSNTLPHGLVMWIAPGLLIVSNAFIFGGIQSFDKRRASLVSIFAGVAIWTAAVCIPAVQSSLPLRAVIVNVLCACYYLQITITVLAGLRAETVASRALVGGLALIHAGFCLVRIPLAIFQQVETLASMMEQPWLGYAVLEAMFNIVAMSLAVTVMECSRAERQQRQAASTDGLTHALNRRAFIQHAQDMIEQSDHPAALVLFDLDHFKRTNDSFGHAAGDMALIAFSNLMERHMQTANDIADFAADPPFTMRLPAWFKTEIRTAPDRRRAIFGRIGGEEFACLLPGLSAAQAATVANDIRHDYRTLNLAHAGQPIPTSVSAGVISTHECQRKLDMMLAEADRALYSAKKKGRNRVEIGRMRAGLPLAAASPDDEATTSTRIRRSHRPGNATA